eukprot:CAMPEP_0177727708 /NCGR_PEP_ID=MMETSP0484_2-20121128/20470_1 /TAXON_ID=354590 /ORGANISM="Rhodomonas lens, Strain RHODO" /LENGTH=208 /DNA_ID=CAMNT_0019240389 /DNA_START=134 /DNA_END=760 /DNA_ORIENTATION=-
MAGFLGAPPQGFFFAVQTLDDLSPSDLEELALQVIKMLLERTGHLSHAELAKKLSQSKEKRELLPFDQDALKKSHQTVNALSFVYKDAVRTRTAPEEVTQALQSIAGLAKSAAALLGRVYQQRSALLLSSARLQSILSVGRLVSFDWKVSLASESSECEKLNAPSITVQFKIALPSGQVATHSAELSLREFEDFADKVGEMTAVLETL